MRMWIWEAYLAWRCEAWARKRVWEGVREVRASVGFVSWGG
jgi:hypothetical protein